MNNQLNMENLEEEELCYLYAYSKETNMFLLEFMKKYYNKSLFDFTMVYSKYFDLDKKKNEKNNTDNYENEFDKNEKIITRCFISRVYWRKLLTGLHPEEKDYLIIKCENLRKKDKTKQYINCYKSLDNKTIDINTNLNNFLQSIDWNNKVFSYVIHPDHEFNILIENGSMYLIQSWLYQYPLRIYHLSGEKEYRKFMEILNNFLVDIYKNNLAPNTIHKILYKLFMCYKEKIYIINNKKIIFKIFNDQYIFDMSKKKEFKKVFKLMINDFTLNNEFFCTKNLKNQNIQKGSGVNTESENLDKKVYFVIMNIISNFKNKNYTIPTNCNSKEASVSEIIIKLKGEEFMLYFVTIKKQEGNLNYVYFNHFKNEIFMKMDKEIFNILYDQISKYSKYITQQNNYSSIDKNIFFLIDLFFRQLLLAIDFSYSGHAYYKIIKSNIQSINLSSQPINMKLYNVNQNNIKSNIDKNFSSQDAKNLLNDFIEIYKLGNKNLDKYNEYLKKYNIGDKFIKLLKKMDYLDINSLYNKISQKFITHHNYSNNNTPIYYFLSIYLYLISFEKNLDEKTHKKYRIFINTLYKDINNELIIPEKKNNIDDQYYKKYNKYKSKYLMLKESDINLFN